MVTQNAPPNLLKTPRIIWAAMAGGLLAFGAVVGRFAPPASPATANAANMMLLTCAILAASCLLLCPLLRVTLTRAVRRQWEANPGSEDPTDDLFPRWMAIWLLGAAMSEAVALYAAVIYMVTGNQFAIALAAGGWLVLAAQFPRKSSVCRFVYNVTGREW